MKTLYIIRHPQKDTSTSNNDISVKLTEQGLIDATAMGQQLKQKNVQPDLIVSSPSYRTKTAAKKIAKELGYEKKVIYNEVLYQGYLEEMIEALTFTFYTVETLVVVGHNPLLSNLANNLVAYKDSMQMGECLRIDFDTDSWVDISSRNSRLVEVIRP